MPYKDAIAERMGSRERMRRMRQRRKREAAPPTAPVVAPGDVDDLATWAKDTLIVPPGHPLAGQPLELPAYGVDFLREALMVPESLLSIARKNAKSAIIAVYLLGRLVGPLRFQGYRAGECSVNREKAGELWMQMEAIAEASRLKGVRCMRAPRHVVSDTGRVDILSAEGNAGHASGFDDVLVDELGLLKERDRELVNGLRTSVSARNGRFIGLSIQGDAPFTQEILERRGNRGLVVHHYTARDDCDLDDEAAWHAANPGLRAGIKSIDYMRHQAARALATPADQPSFRAYDLNQPQDPAGQLLIDAQDWRACEVELSDLSGQLGPMVLGVDLSSGYAMSAAAAYWPETGRLQGICAFPSEPGLRERGTFDGVGGLYRQMAERQELIVTSGRTVNIEELLHWALSEYGQPTAVVCDRWRLAELQDGLEAAGIPPGVVLTRGMGWQDGSQDVLAFQRAVKERRVKTTVSLAARSAFSGAVVAVDPAGNQKLAKKGEGGRKQRHKDDLVAAAMLAVSAGVRHYRPQKAVAATEVFIAR